MRYIYTGPSWAASSYPVNDQATNLAKEWKIPFIDASQMGSSVLNRVRFVKSLNSKLPIVWIYNEPFGDLTTLTNLSDTELLQRSDWEEIWHECNRKCLSEISKLGVPILLIGGHSDIVDCTHSNITVACASWQKWLASQANMPISDNKVYVKMDDGGDFEVSRCWGAEGVHKVMHACPAIEPCPSLVNAVWDIFFFWKELEKANLFYEVHPNLQGTKQFAEFLKPMVTEFLKETQ